jgi:hypothetical protein
MRFYFPLAKETAAEPTMTVLQDGPIIWFDV